MDLDRPEIGGRAAVAPIVAATLLSLWIGPSLAFERGDEAFLLAFPEVTEGMPAVEVWSNPLLQGLVDGMRDTYRTGDDLVFTIGTRRVLITRASADGTAGVVMAMAQ